MAVMQVVDRGPAAIAGIRSGDLIVRLAGNRVEDASDLQRVMTTETIGAPLPVELIRDGERRTVTVIPSELR
jgi:S1-C subfamily serine protease